MKVVKREKSTSTRGHYVTNAVLLPAVIEAKALGKVTDKLAKMIMMIAERYSRKSNFIGYSFREDMVSVAMVNLCNNALKFDPEKSANPFSFYTTAIHHSFLQYMADEKKHRMVRDTLFIDSGANPSFNFTGEESHELRESDTTSYNPAPIHIDDIDLLIAPLSPAAQAELDAAPKEKIIKYRFQCRQPGEMTTLKPGIDFTQDEKGNIIMIEKAPVAVKKPRKTKLTPLVDPTEQKKVAKKTTATVE